MCVFSVCFCVFLWEVALTAELVNRNYLVFIKLEALQVHTKHTHIVTLKQQDSVMIVWPVC